MAPCLRQLRWNGIGPGPGQHLLGNNPLLAHLWMQPGSLSSTLLSRAVGRCEAACRTTAASSSPRGGLPSDGRESQPGALRVDVASACPASMPKLP